MGAKYQGNRFVHVEVPRLLKTGHKSTDPLKRWTDSLHHPQSLRHRTLAAWDNFLNILSERVLCLPGQCKRDDDVLSCCEIDLHFITINSACNSEAYQFAKNETDTSFLFGCLVMQKLLTKKRERDEVIPEKTNANLWLAIYYAPFGWPTPRGIYLFCFQKAEVAGFLT